MSIQQYISALVASLTPSCAQLMHLVRVAVKPARIKRREQKRWNRLSNRVRTLNRTLSYSSLWNWTLTKVYDWTSKFLKRTMEGNSKMHVHLSWWRAVSVSSQLRFSMLSKISRKCRVVMKRRSIRRLFLGRVCARLSGKRSCLRLRIAWMIQMILRMRYCMEQPDTYKLFSYWSDLWYLSLSQWSLTNMNRDPHGKISPQESTK